MARDIPSAPKVFTHIYEDFKGVDFTNDSTNVWHKRSPSAVNMLPDEAGRPFKRHGWEVLLSNADISSFLGVDGCSINKCSYFELAGVDHIVIFTDAGVIFYNGDLSTAIYSKEQDCFTSHDRCFFFEGDGTSAFYIYGNYRVWRYEYDDGFMLTEVTKDLTIPIVLISAEADCTGTLLYGYNLVGNYAYIQYCGTDLFAYWGSDGLAFTVDKDTFIGLNPKNFSQKYTYDGSVWKDESDTTVDMNALGIVPADPKEDDEIFVVNANGILLPNNIDPVSQLQDLTVWESTTVQFDTEMEVITSGTPTDTQARLHADDVKRKKQQAWFEFKSDKTFIVPVEEEDFLKVKFPTSIVHISSESVPAFTAQTTIVGTAV